MKAVKTPQKKTPGECLDTLNQLADKHKQVNQLIAAGKSIAPEITQHFVTFPLHDNPFEKLGL